MSGRLGGRVAFSYITKMHNSNIKTVPSGEEAVSNGDMVVLVTGEVVVVSNHGKVPSPFIPSAI